MADNASRRGAADLGMPLMFLAFITIGGFLWWLSGEAAAERALVIVEDTTTATDMGTATTIAATDLETDATPFEGQLVRVAGLNVASMLGTQGFWLDLPNQSPFLVSMSEDVMAEGVPVTLGQPATVTGVVHAMSDSVLSAWTAAGTIGDGERLAAEFATHYLEATGIVVANPSGAGGSGDGN